VKNKEQAEAEAHHYIRLLKKGQRNVFIKQNLTSVCYFFAILLICLSALILVEYKLYLSSLVKSIALVSFILMASGVAYYYYKKRQRSSFINFYRSFCEKNHLPQLKYLLDFHHFNRFENSSLYEAARQQNRSSLSGKDIAGNIKNYLKQHPVTSQVRRSFASGLIAISIFSILSFTITDGVVRSLSFWKSFDKPNPFEYVVIPGNTVIEQASTFEPAIHFSNKMIPDKVLLGVKTSLENKYRLRQMEVMNDTSFKASGISLSNDIQYFIKMDGFKSQVYTANVQLRPRFDLLSARITPPAYTELQPLTITYPFSAVRGYEGSTITIQGSLNKEISRLVLKSTRQDTTNIPVNAKGKFKVDLPMQQTDTLSFNIEDKSGLQNKNPFSFTLNPIQDEYPYVSINKPEGQLSMVEPDTVPVIYEASDDFGLTSAALKINVKKAFVKNIRSISIDIPTPSLKDPETYIWDIDNLSLKPRDEVVYWIEVRDNDEINGYKPASSQKLVLRVPSLTEHFDEIEQQESNTQDALEEVSESYQKIQEEYQSFKNQLKEGDDNKWDQNRKLEEIKQQRKKMDQKVEELNKEFEKLRKSLEEENMLSEETLESYKELEKLMKEIDDPEIMNMIEELQKSLQQFNQNQLQDAMQKLEFNEEAYQERLERTLELFKQLKLNSDLEKMARALDNLSEQEKEVIESEEANPKKAEQQKAIKKDLENLNKKINEIDENSTESNQKQVKELQENTRRKFEEIQKELQENIEQLQKEQNGAKKGEKENKNGAKSPSQIKQQQQQIQQQLQQTAQQMRESQQQMTQQQQQINLAALENILHGLLTQSHEQEQLTEETDELAPRSRAFVEKARIQKNISTQFSRLSDSLTAVSADIPQLSNHINKKKLTVERNLEKSVEHLSERDRRQSTIAERQALGGINELTSMIASLIEQLNNQSGQGGAGGMSAQQMMEQMQNMSGQQQQINQQLQEMINDIQGQRLSQDQMQRLNQLAKQQNRIRKQLEELKKSGALEPGDKLLSEMERLSEEMEDAINDIRGGAVDRPMIKRQQNILSRMLEAEKALQERGKSEKEREAETAEELPDGVSPDVTLEELQKMIRQRLQDPEQTNFSRDYQQLIELYFKLLRQEENISSTP